MPYSSNFSLIPLLTSLAFYSLTLAQEASETIIRNPLEETPTQDTQDSEIPGVTAPPEAPVAPGTIGNRNGSPGGDSKAGAKGPDDGSFSLSKGGMIAIIIVVVLVVIVGISSAVLYVVAKRRQWEVRKSIARASRRLTGRRDTSANNSSSRKSQAAKGQINGRPRPSTMHVKSSPSTTNRSTTPPKSRTAAAATSDLEKGKLYTTVKSKESGMSENKDEGARKKNRFAVPWSK